MISDESFDTNHSCFKDNKKMSIRHAELTLNAVSLQREVTAFDILLEQSNGQTNREGKWHSKYRWDCSQLPSALMSSGGEYVNFSVPVCSGSSSTHN